MKKIIAAINPSSFSHKKLLSFMDCAQWAEGKFCLALLDTDTAVPLVHTFEGIGYYGYSRMDWKSLEEKERFRAEKVDSFLDACRNNGLSVPILSNRTITVEELVREARFADLLIIDSSVSFSPMQSGEASDDLQRLLHEAALPVILLRDGAIDIEELIFTYNGSASSVYAIKQFTNLFPLLAEKPVTVLYVNESKTDSIPDHVTIMSYLKHHYSKVGFRILNGNPSREISLFLKNKKTALVTFGAYGRSALSRFFHPSEADHTLRSLKLPVFITHL